MQAVYLRCTTYLRTPLFGMIPVVTLFVVAYVRGCENSKPFRTFTWPKVVPLPLTLSVCQTHKNADPDDGAFEHGMATCAACYYAIAAVER